jgi:hypothetical protein
LRSLDLNLLTDVFNDSELSDRCRLI